MVSQGRDVGAISDCDVSMTWRCRSADRVIRNGESSDVLREQSVEPIGAGSAHIKGNGV